MTNIVIAEAGVVLAVLLKPWLAFLIVLAVIEVHFALSDSLVLFEKVECGNWSKN